MTPLSISPDILSVREIEKEDFGTVVDYYLKADKNFLLGMGVDASKLPKREAWIALLSNDFQQPVESKKIFYVIWLLDHTPVGHSSLNKIIFGEEAYMHLHLWDAGKRQKGMGVELIKKSLPFYFDLFKLKKLYCEPKASNAAPNHTLRKAGFIFVKQYEINPGWINFHQIVNRWSLEADVYQKRHV